MGVPTEMKGKGVMNSESIKTFVQEHGHVLKNLRVIERRGKIFAEFDGTIEGVRIILMGEGITRAVLNGNVVKVSCAPEDIYDPIIGIALAEKRVILKVIENRAWPRYKKAISQLGIACNEVSSEW